MTDPDAARDGAVNGDSGTASECILADAGASPVGTYRIRWLRLRADTAWGPSDETSVVDCRRTDCYYETGQGQPTGGVVLTCANTYGDATSIGACYRQQLVACIDVPSTGFGALCCPK